MVAVGTVHPRSGRLYQSLVVNLELAIGDAPTRCFSPNAPRWRLGCCSPDHAPAACLLTRRPSHRGASSFRPTTIAPLRRAVAVSAISILVMPGNLTNASRRSRPNHCPRHRDSSHRALERHHRESDEHGCRHYVPAPGFVSGPVEKIAAHPVETADATGNGR